MKEKSIEMMRLDGGCLVFDFVNTVNSRVVEKDHHEYLSNYREFLKWSRKVNLISADEAEAFKKRAVHFTAEASGALQKIRDARELLFTFFDSIITHSNPEKAILEKFNSLLSHSLKHLRITENLNWHVPLDTDDLTSPLNRILLSAYETLKDTQQERLKKCEACAWLFIDTTKNGKRKYCSPETCGSTEKAKRYYHRKKAEGDYD